MERAHSIMDLGQKILPAKSTFINAELTPFAKTTYACAKCSTTNNIIITPYQTGYPFGELYKKGLISAEQILVSSMASKSSNWANHFGEFLVENLPTLYYIDACQNCRKRYLLVFGFGESQPGKMMCVISGVWGIK